MKKIQYFVFLLCLLTATSLVSCGDDGNNNAEKPQVGITEQSWNNGEALEISKGQDLTVNFTATAKWVARITEGADWCKLSKTSGTEGRNTIILSVSTTSSTDRTAKIAFYVDGYAPVSLAVTQKATEPEETEDTEVNRQVDEYLKEMYLWNDEYKTLKLDFTKNYEEFFYGALGSMKTNTLDKRPNGNGGYSLFSYIEKKSPVGGSTRAGTQIEREQEYCFGFTGMIAVMISKDKKYAFCIQGVYPDSPASAAGIKRGTYISQVNGQAITESNVQSLFLDLMFPESTPTLKLTEFIIHENNSTETKEIPAITAKAMYKNPILYRDIIETGGHKIGYLVYSGFDAGFDDLLFDVFKEFKTKGIEDLVLDLRYNGGGHVTSANLIASCVAGSKSKGLVFAKYRYNDERMKKIEDKNEEPFLYDYYANLKSSLTAGGLNLNRLYCLVGNQTASASELVINSLRGIDTEVILIGERTTGKNVGMEPVDITARGNTYRVVPITFQTYNAKGFGDYQEGFKPEIPLDETDADGDGYFDDYTDYGKPEEPLLARAIQEITKQTPPQVRSLNRKGIGRTILPMPVIYRPGHDGMIKFNEPAR